MNKIYETLSIGGQSRVTPIFIFSLLSSLFSSMDNNKKSDCEDCGGNFPLKSTDDLCHKCTKLKLHVRESPDYVDIMVGCLRCYIHQKT